MDNTDIIFIGDNGDDNLVAQTNPSKGTIYQGGIAVPFIISGPDVVNPNRTSDALVNTVDLFSTILELFGDANWQSQIPTTVVDSQSLLPILLNTKTAIRPWSFSEVFRVTPLASDGKMIRNQDYKLLKFSNGTEKFFNLILDPTETNNLLIGLMSVTDITNYNYLCSEMTTLVGAGSFCNPLSNNNFTTRIDTSIFYPNPAKENIYITFKNNSEFSKKIEILNTLGQVVYKNFNPINVATVTIPVQQYLNGLYFIRLTDGNEIKTFKVIIDNKQ